MLRTLLLSFCLVSALFEQDILTNATGEKVFLNDLNFHHSIQHYDLALVSFFTRNSAYFIHADDQMELASGLLKKMDLYKKQVYLVGVDCQASKRTCDEVGLEHATLPVFKVFEHGKFQHDFTEDVTHENIVNFIASSLARREQIAGISTEDHEEDDDHDDHDQSEHDEL
jgi:hypothetical protein